ncbi:MAG: hypothetical protein ABIH85_01005 [Candidatus Omnitrophota bacterium]|nr:hypothetical protein [Candidatus Omnitrophota bacterium]MBU1894928.1 hypothetical protein [Candidatus Omnitrophota bacterium]
MKKYLQACEFGGSIYGKKRTTSKKKSSGTKRSNKSGLASSYTSFYKKQFAVMDKFFKQDK